LSIYNNKENKCRKGVKYMERLDKILANLGYGTRKEVKALIKNKEVEVDGEIVKDNGMKVDPEKNEIKVQGEVINYRKFIYILMNKPEGVVSATFDNYDETVIDLLDSEYQVFNPFPVGRLDKDTVGLLLITNDGELNHRLISPKNHVDKVYFAQIDKAVDEKDVAAFHKGVILDDGYKCMPAKLEIIKADKDGSEVNVTIQEGKFHQVKRMFESRDKKVVYLKRIKFGFLDLDTELDEGYYRELSKKEVDILKSI
jgi:16S rRNA pseudouridine516 synthase